ncbi:malto-oligosyltrehalose synthase [Solimonas marina]|uniref:Malto-oligosyltrehalose synthase n=1 Tax=Solimonas marina TaxID=2714601 RepID=A0A969WCA2_9GAMM|nr:malto-oligosyltrehalose synthase [Solimonas marina]NKF23470.1 malto-oligosyltrehalose synthase [Solimonas marina]
MPAEAVAIRATMRLQLHRDFGFADAAAQIDYAARLGISHFYLSPILGARSGSMHGYDVVDPTVINPELGGEDGLRNLVARLRARGMGVIVDIVPNHMAVGRDDNAWWLDVLEWGPDSRYARFFDIDWDVPDLALRGRVDAPFLGKPYGDALADGELRLNLEDDGRLSVRYYEHCFPLAPTSYAALLRSAGDALAAHAQRFTDALATRSRGARWHGFETARRELAEALRTSAPQHDAIKALLGHYNQGDRRLLHALLERQHWRLAWWRTAADEINWRRFFDVIELAGLRAEEPAVFEATHALIFRLYAQGLIDGVRIDHVDGLADPRAYCRKLRTRLLKLASQRPPELPRDPAYLVVEKILAPDETLPRDWRCDGSSGYDFMNDVGAVLHAASGTPALSALWTRLSGHSGDFEREAMAARRRIPQALFTADFEACARTLHRIARADPRQRDWSLAAIRRVLTELLVHFPLYRTYADARGRSAADAAVMQTVCEAARRSVPRGEQALVDQLDRWLGCEAPQSLASGSARALRLRAIARFQQLTSPVAAKSIEDTAFYRYGVLVSRNEVGADPAQFAIDVATFHRQCLHRAQRYPKTMLATATHDHKRGEDVRARLAVLSEMPEQWQQQVLHWRQRNAALKATRDGMTGPDATDEYILYQMLVGAWPPGLRATDRDGLADYCGRLSAWQEKAVREAKRHSAWVEPNLDYETACRRFLEALCADTVFVAELAGFVDRIAGAGAVNGLVQTALRLTTPGVPDTYQGCDFWDFSLVDPDNRRAVDYSARQRALDDPRSDDDLLDDWRDGHIKQRLIARLLGARQQYADCFATGRYRPLMLRGRHAGQLLAFSREWQDTAVLVVVPLHPYTLYAGRSSLRTVASEQRGTRIELPQALRRRWRSVLDGKALDATTGLDLSQALQSWPLLVATTTIDTLPTSRPREAV